MKNNKHIPYRTCVGCRGKKAKKELIRFAYQENKIIFDLQQILQGRGKYLCPNIACLLLAVKKKVFERLMQKKIEKDDVLLLESDFQICLTKFWHF